MHRCDAHEQQKPALHMSGTSWGQAEDGHARHAAAHPIDVDTNVGEVGSLAWAPGLFDEKPNQDVVADQQSACFSLK